MLICHRRNAVLLDRMTTFDIRQFFQLDYLHQHSQLYIDYDFLYLNLSCTYLALIPTWPLTCEIPLLHQYYHIYTAYMVNL